MKQILFATVALALGLAELALGWRLSLWGVSPDLLFAMAACTAMQFRRDWAIPSACCLGIWSDLIAGGRLGVMAIGYGLGVRTILGLRPSQGSGAGLRILSLLGIYAGGTALAHLLPAAASIWMGIDTAPRALAKVAGVALLTAPVSLFFGWASGLLIYGRIARAGGV